MYPLKGNSDTSSRDSGGQGARHSSEVTAFAHGCRINPSW